MSSVSAPEYSTPVGSPADNNVSKLFLLSASGSLAAGFKAADDMIFQRDGFFQRFRK